MRTESGPFQPSGWWGNSGVNESSRVQRMRGKERDPLVLQPDGTGAVIVTGYEPWEEMELVKFGARRKGKKLVFPTEEEAETYVEATRERR